MTRQRPSSGASDIKNKRILVVDDDALLSNVVKEMLAAELGCEVQVVGCASDALSQMAVQPFDVVITDLHMPGMDGLDLMGRIQAWYPRTCLVLMTADRGPHVDQALSRFRDSEVEQAVLRRGSVQGGGMSLMPVRLGDPWSWEALSKHRASPGCCGMMPVSRYQIVSESSGSMDSF